MSSLLWRISSKDFRECRDCKIVRTEKMNVVKICDAHRDLWKIEDERTAALDPTDENIREIVNGRLDLFACKRIYEHFYDLWHREMPYGTAKARDGDPYEWIFNELCSEYSHLMEPEEVSV